MRRKRTGGEDEGSGQTSIMDKKAQHKNVLEDVLTGLDSDSSPCLEELDKLIHRSFRLTPPSAAEAGGSLLDRALRLTSTGKRKTTIYLTDTLAKDLDQAKEKLKEMVPDEARAYTSKSAIANIALRVLLRDLEQRGEESILMRQLMKLPRKAQA